VFLLGVLVLEGMSLSKEPAYDVVGIVYGSLAATWIEAKDTQCEDGNAFTTPVV